MSSIQDTQQLSYICRNARLSFRKSVWIEVVRVGIANNSKTRKTLQDAVEITADDFRILEYSNLNMVRLSRDAVEAANPVCIVVLHVNMAESHTRSQEFVEQIVRNATIHGDVTHNTHIIVQIFFVCERDNAIVHDAVSVVMVDGAGVAYFYNTPEGDHAQIAFECVSRLLQITTGTVISIAHHVVPFEARSRYDYCLYVVFLTASCTTESVSSAIRNANAPISDLINCRPSSRCARPTRVISNIRFLLFLCKPSSRKITEELLLDETNMLHSFRSVVVPPTCSDK